MIKKFTDPELERRKWLARSLHSAWQVPASIICAVAVAVALAWFAKKAN